MKTASLSPRGDPGRPQSAWNSRVRVGRWGRRSAHTPAGPGAQNPGGAKGPPDLPGEPGGRPGSSRLFPAWGQTTRAPCGPRARDTGLIVARRFLTDVSGEFSLTPAPWQKPRPDSQWRQRRAGGRPLRTAALSPAWSPHCFGLTLEKKNKKKKEHGSCHARSQLGSLAPVQFWEAKAWCGIADHGTGHRSKFHLQSRRLRVGPCGRRTPGPEAGDATARVHVPGGGRWAGRVLGLSTRNHPTRWAISPKKQQRCLGKERG